MSIALIGGREQKKEAGFRRIEGHSLDLGMVVCYRIDHTPPFQIVAHRDGIDIAGRFPRVERQGVEALMDIMARAIRHHEHLRSFEPGEPQTIMSEDVFEIEEAQRDAQKLKVI